MKERLEILEAGEDSIFAQLARRRHAVCAVCGMELFPDMVLWRELREHERRFKPPRNEPDDMSVHVSHHRGKDCVSVCSSCKTRDPQLPVPFLDPVPPEVTAGGVSTLLGGAIALDEARARERFCQGHRHDVVRVARAQSQAPDEHARHLLEFDSSRRAAAQERGRGPAHHWTAAGGTACSD